MGDLAQEFGFYGESWDPAKYGDAYVMGEAGEGEPSFPPHELHGILFCTRCITILM
jgi:hypothetical protein